RRAAGASRRELAWRWTGIGFIVGLGLWVNPLICYAILAVTMWIVWDWVKALREARRSKIIQFDDDQLDRSIVGAGLAPALENPQFDDDQLDRSIVEAGLAPALENHLKSTPMRLTNTGQTFLKILFLPALDSIQVFILGLAP